MCLADEKPIRSKGAPRWSVLMACSAEVDTCTLGVATKVLEDTSPVLNEVPPPKLGGSLSGRENIGSRLGCVGFPMSLVDFAIG